MFAPFGKIYSLEVYRGLLGVKKCLGAKHSSLRRELEWQRLRLRDELRPDFQVFTGNDLAIDMVMYGSDYLLGLSTFAPDLFARRDRYWETGDPRFYELNDVLQYLGFLAFRDPVPAYKHSAAMFLKLRGWIGCDATHPQSPSRPESDLRTSAWHCPAPRIILDPLTSNPRMPMTAPDAPTPLPLNPCPTPSRSVLVVEDEPTIRMIARTALARAGFQVTEAGDLATAAEAVRTAAEPFDLVMLDLTLPDGDGAARFPSSGSAAPRRESWWSAARENLTRNPSGPMASSPSPSPGCHFC